MYNLYKYKKYDDMRLVFAPEFAIAFFGGDPDNFEYPRYDLDISFFRAYENGEPAKIHDYLKWSTDGRQARRPGIRLRSSGPYRPSAHHGPARIPARLSVPDAAEVVQAPHRRAAESSVRNRPENEREAQSDMFGLQNSFKAVTGYRGWSERQRPDGHKGC